MRLYEDVILATIEEAVPGKHPVVCKDHFSTDALTRGEAVSLGRELSKIAELAALGKTVTVFRLFDGETVDVFEEEKEEKNDTRKQPCHGGHK